MKERKLFKRDVSWLAFNHRVLQEAADPSVPLYERIKFLAIFSSNLDEFYRTRVAALLGYKELDKDVRRKIGAKPKKILKQIRIIVHGQQEEFGRIFGNMIIPELQRHGIELVLAEEFTDQEKAFATTYFEDNIKRLLDPLVVKALEETPFLENKALYFVVDRSDVKDMSYGLVKIPSDQLPRFVIFPGHDGKYRITFLDEVIRCNLDKLFPGKVEAFAVKLSRDADLGLEDEFAGDLVEKIISGLEMRDKGIPTRFLYDARIPEDFLTRLKASLNLTKNELIPGARHHNFNDFIEFPNPLDDPELRDEPREPIPHPVLHEAHSVLDQVQYADQVLHFPYQDFHVLPRIFREAAQHPRVASIKMTLYRVGNDSEILDTLLAAAKAGKDVFVFMEVKARFDEASNINWGRKMEEAGATVRYSHPGIKVHAKTFLIQFDDDARYRDITYIGTGNFNQKTARIYCDHGILTADKRITHGINQVFDLLEKKIIVPKTDHLFISPFTTRTGFEALVHREIDHAQDGETAYMILKMNSLEDPLLISRLYDASQAGVQIRIICRGICCLKPGVPGMSENIEVISIVDRFLEHARIYIFANGGDERMYIGSADWMVRNLDRRIEVIAPVFDDDVYQQLRKLIDFQLADRTKARIINSLLTNPYKQKKPGQKAVRAQIAFYDYLHTLWENRNARREGKKKEDVKT